MKMHFFALALLPVFACPLFAQDSMFEGQRVTKFTKEWIDGYRNYHKDVYLAYIKNVKDVGGTEYPVEIWHGPVVSYIHNGKTEGVYRDGKREGLFVYQDTKNGVKVESHWLNGLKNDGTTIQSASDGRKMIEQIYKKGQIISEAGWDTKRNLLFHGTYKNGAYWEGTFVSSDLNNKTSMYLISTYKKGKKISEKSITENWWW
jgi:hypothetical protein